MNTSVKLSLLLPLAAVSLFLGGCVAPEYASFGYSSGRPAGYYGDSYADFYYTGRNPYSREYGQLYYRGGGYYYMRGNTYVIYSRPTLRYSDWERRRSSRDYRRDDRRDYRRSDNRDDSYRRDQTRTVNYRQTQNSSVYRVAPASSERRVVTEVRRDSEPRIVSRSSTDRQDVRRDVSSGERRVGYVPAKVKKEGRKEKSRDKKKDDDNN
jgi:hypothetical protein